MINYIEKGRGLHDKIATMGYSLEYRNGEWYSDNPTVVQSIIDNYSLDEAKKIILNDIDVYARNMRNYVMQAISPAEMASWPIKREEAMKYLETGLSSSAPNLAIEATERNMSLEALANLVMQKAYQFAGMESKVAGICGKHQDAVRSMTTFEEVLTYDWTQGWPEF